MYIQLFADLYSTIRPVMREIRFFAQNRRNVSLLPREYQLTFSCYYLPICPLTRLSVQRLCLGEYKFQKFRKGSLGIAHDFHVFLLFFPLGRLCPLIYSINEILLDLKTLGPIYLLLLLPFGLMFTFFFLTHEKESRNILALFLELKYLCASIDMLVKWCSVENQVK